MDERQGANATLILLRHLRSEDATTRQGAAMALGRLGDPEAVPGLIDALGDNSDAVRQAAVWALGQIGDPRATSGLTEALADADQHVRRTAATALGWMDGAAQIAPALPEKSHGGPVRRIRKRRRSRPARNGLVIGSVLVILSGIFALLAIRAWHAPLGPELAVEDEEDQPPPLTLPAPVPVPPRCGGPPVMYLLVIGSDARENDYESGFADVIRLIRVDFVSPSAMLLAIPRDLWVPIPQLEAQGIVENRIKTAYAYGNRYGVPGGGPGLLARTLAQNFDLHADHYIVVNFAAFEEGIDAIGGIDLDVPEQLGDPLSGASYFPAGWQHMDGPAALRYARIREDITDLSRIERQTQVIMAIRERVLSPSILSSLPGLVQSARASILTDLSPSEISMLTCLAEQIEPDAIQVMNIDATMTTSVIDPWGHEMLIPDYPAIAGLVRAFDAGGAP
jgi:LCP family protein required for cell wall assembly